MKKKLLFILIVLFSFCVRANAEVYKYKAESFSYKSVNDYGYWSDWSEWEKCSILVVISIDKDLISIYSSETQEFDIISSEESSDTDGNPILQCQCVDKNGLRCQIRVRSDGSGGLQLYVDYNDFMYVYNIVKR